MNRRKILLFGYLGLIASVMVGIGEFLLHYNANGFDESIPYSYFLGIPAQRLTIGHYLMVPFIPLYIFGYYHIYLALKSGTKWLAKAVLVLGVFAFVIGGIWVGSRAHLGYTLQILSDSSDVILRDQIVSSYDLHVENLVNILRILILLISIAFTIAILKGGTLYHKWMVFFNPILLLIFVFALFFYVRPIGQYLAPSAMNVAHFILFNASILSIRSNIPNHQ